MNAECAQGCNIERVARASAAGRRERTLARLALLSLLAARAGAQVVQPSIDNRDYIEKAVAPGLGAQAAVNDHLSVLLGDQFTYDDNVYRLPTGVDVFTVVGLGASRQDHINAETVEIDGQHTLGRQVFILDAQAANNRFVQNTDLNNVSTKDRLAWLWQFSDLFSGQLGADYSKTLASFVNSVVYRRNIFQNTRVYGTGRYQVGPHWAIFGGVFNTNSKLNAAESQANDNDAKAVDVGTEYAFDPNDNLGFEYRYTDTSFSHSPDPAFSDYREDIGQVLFKYAFTERTLLDASAGYLKRMYAVPEFRDFSGNVWRATLQWLPTEKTKLMVNGWRRLQAYETAQLAYFVSSGGGLVPSWTPTEKITVSVDGSYESQKYIGSGAPSVVVFTARHDTVSAEHANFTYLPIPAVTLTFSYGHERRNSNYAQYSYRDRVVLVSGSFKF